MRYLLLLLSITLIGCATTIPAKSWLTQNEYRAYYHLDRLPGSWSGDFVDVGEYDIWTWSITPVNPSQTLLILHGFLDHSALNLQFYEYALNRGCRIVLFDLPGHGRSGGERAGLSDFNEYRSALAAVMGRWNLKAEETVFVGHSTGGAIIMDAIMEGMKPKAVLLASPLVRFRQFGGTAFALNFASSRWKVGVSKRECCRNESFNRMKRSDPMGHGRMPLSWPKAIVRWERSLTKGEVDYHGPFLVLQGEKDHVVDYKHNLKRISQWFPSSLTNTYPGLMHHILNELPGDQVYGDITDFFEGLSL